MHATSKVLARQPMPDAAGPRILEKTVCRELVPKSDRQTSRVQSQGRFCADVDNSEKGFGYPRGSNYLHIMCLGP